MNGADADQTANTVAVPEGVDAELLMMVLEIRRCRLC